MQIIFDMPDDIIARSLNDTIELSLEVDCEGTVRNIYTQEYGFKELRYSTLNSLCTIDILRLKRQMENEE